MKMNKNPCDKCKEKECPAICYKYEQYVEQCYNEDKRHKKGNKHKGEQY